MPPQIGTLLIPRDIGAEWGYRQAEELTRHLKLRLNQPVALFIPQDPAAQLAPAIQSLVDAGVSRVVALPLGLLPLTERGIVSRSIAWAQREWPVLSFLAAVPLTWLEWSGWLRLTALESLNTTAVDPKESAVLLVGQGHANPLTNANLARIAHLIWETSPLASASHAFLGNVRPNIHEAIGVLAREGFRNVVTMPWLLSDESLLRLDTEIKELAVACGVNATVARPSLAHPALVNIFVSNHYAALSDDRVRIPADGDESSPPSAQRRITAEEAFELDELERRLNALLPPEYQGRYEDVRPESMGSAGLKFDGEGKVAWGEIWTSFCDLALAGGPPHRGTLLEAVTSEEATSEPEQYQAVVAEIERGLRLVTSLSVVRSRTPGWVGVRCESEEMAIWIMRAVIVENIMVRREQDVLYLPAGPRFTVKREIKNVVTAVAKTVHYWTAHLMARRCSQDENP